MKNNNKNGKAKLPSISEHTKIDKALKEIFKRPQVLEKRNGQGSTHQGDSLGTKYTTPKAVINKNQMPGLKKALPRLKAAETDRELLTVHIGKFVDLNRKNQEPLIAHCFSPKIKYRRHNKIKSNYVTTEESSKIHTNIKTESSIIKRVMDLNDSVFLPIDSLQKVEKKSINPLNGPKTKRFVTVSFNQIMLKDLYKNKQRQKQLKNLFLYKYLSLEEMNKKLMLF